MAASWPDWIARRSGRFPIHGDVGAHNVLITPGGTLCAAVACRSGAGRGTILPRNGKPLKFTRHICERITADHRSRDEARHRRTSSMRLLPQRYVLSLQQCVQTVTTTQRFAKSGMNIASTGAGWLENIRSVAHEAHRVWSNS
jgi:hypothetical protein